MERKAECGLAQDFEDNDESLERWEQVERERDVEADAATQARRAQIERECEREANRTLRREHQERHAGCNGSMS